MMDLNADEPLSKRQWPCGRRLIEDPAEVGRTAVPSNIDCNLSGFALQPALQRQLVVSEVCRRRFDGKRVLAKVVPNPSATAMLVQRAALDQRAEMLLERIAAGAGQFDGLANGDAAMLAGKFDDL